MSNKWKKFSFIALSGAMLFSFAFVGQKINASISAKAANSGQPFTGDIVFTGTSTAVSGVSRRYSCMGTTQNGQVLYLISDYPANATPGSSLMSLGDLSSTSINWFISEFPNGKENDQDSYFTFQSINSISFVKTAGISGHYWNAATASSFPVNGTDFSVNSSSTTFTPSSAGKTMKFDVRGSLSAVTISSISFNYTCGAEPTIKYSVASSSSEHGSIILGSQAQYAAGETVNFSVSPDVGYVVDTVGTSPEVVLSSEGNNYSFTMPASNVVINATFKVITKTYTLSYVEPTNGTIAIQKSQYCENETVTFTVTPNSGYEINTVTINSEDITSSGVSGQFTFNMPACDVEIIATFKKIVAPVTTDTYYYQQAGYVSTYNCYIYINSDDTGYYEATKVGGATYTYYFDIVSRSGSTLTIKESGDSHATLINTNVNIWNSQSNYQNTITLLASSLNVRLFYANSDPSGTQRTFAKQ